MEPEGPSPSSQEPYLLITQLSKHEFTVRTIPVQMLSVKTERCVQSECMIQFQLPVYMLMIIKTETSPTARQCLLVTVSILAVRSITVAP
jgi:hypothetical protein